MKKNQISICLISILFFNFTLLGQSNPDKVLQLVNNNYNNINNLTLNLTYRFFKNENKKPFKVIKGFYYKKGKKSYTELGEAIMLNTAKYFLKLNKKEKAMLVSKPLNTNQLYFSRLDSIPGADTKLIDKKKYWIIEIKAKEISQFPYVKVLLYIDKDKQLVTKEVFYMYSNLVYNDETGKNEPVNYVLEILFDNYNTTTVLKDEIFDYRRYFKEISGKLKPVSPYNNYEIIDKRSL